MKQEKVYAVVRKPNDDCEIRLLDNEPKAFSAVIEGKREVIPFPALPNVCVIFDGEAVKKDKKPNCFLPEYNDVILGAAVFAGINFEKGFISLTEEQAVKVEEYIKTNDAKDTGNIKERILSEYLPYCEKNYLFGLLCEVKTKYKAVKIKWLGRR